MELSESRTRHIDTIRFKVKTSQGSTEKRLLAEAGHEFVVDHSDISVEPPPPTLSHPAPPPKPAVLCGRWKCHNMFQVRVLLVTLRVSEPGRRHAAAQAPQNGMTRLASGLDTDCTQQIGRDKPDTALVNRNTPHWAQNTGLNSQHIEHCILDWTRETGYSTLDTTDWTQHTGHWTVDTTNWTVDTAHVASRLQMNFGDQLMSLKTDFA